MSADLPKSYAPADWEDQIRARWDDSRAFHADPIKAQASGLKPFSIVIPPPNVTAALHLGHAFNNTLQDILTRYHRMAGFETLWMPGTDHAGIATQAVVEKRLLLQGVKRREIGREKFVEKVQAWKDEYEATILDQLKTMGCSCDFDRTRFTMDEVCAKAVREAFFRLFKDGLIYRGKRLVNWDPASQTALADDEVEMEEVQGFMYYLRYPVIDDASIADAHGLQSVGVSAQFITVATTRPETMLGDVAVAMNPKDPRAPHFVGKHIRLPIVDRVIPLIADDYVVRPVEFGGDENDGKAKIATGFLKVTPAHDDNDYAIGQRHDLPIINVFAPDASISEKHGWADVSAEAKQFLGLSREDAREAIVKWFDKHRLLEGKKPYTHSVGHSYRSHVPIEPYLSDQWYVKVTDDRLRGEALRAMVQRDETTSENAFDALSRVATRPRIDEAVAAHTSDAPGSRSDPAKGDGALTFYPARYAKTFQSWHENIRDWCISRQIWWGHRIPVWTFKLDPVDAPEHDLDDLLAYDVVEAIYEAPMHFGKPQIAADEITYRSFADGRVQICARTIEAIGAIQFIEDEFRRERKIQFPPGRDFSDVGTLIESLRAIEQDPDVLDTWFSSALWPISTMGWPEPDTFPSEIPEGSALLNAFNPSSVLCTAREIITLWVSRMVMFNRYLCDGKLPFKDVYIHAMIQDGHGQKMSKSLGNGVDPRDIIHSHGADALRFTLAKLATSTQDVRLPVDMICPFEDCRETFQPKEITTSSGYKVADATQACPKCKRKVVSGYGAALGLATPSKEMPLARNSSRKFDDGRNFANKLWNATRFALANLQTSTAHADAHGLQSVGVKELSLADRWIISRLHRTLHAVEDALKDYQFNAYCDAMYDFVWRDFCDWYLEAIKPTIKTNANQQQVLRTTLNAMLRLLHPIMPFVTEALWPAVTSCGIAGLQGVKLDASEILATAAWPDIACDVDDEAAIATFERVQSLVNAIRNIRAERQVPLKKKIHLAAPPQIAALIDEAGGVVESLAMIDSIETLQPGAARPAACIPFAFEGGEVLLSGLVDAVDVEAEKARLAKVIAEKEKAVIGFRGRLSNEGYISKAPPEKVAETKQMLAQAEADLDAARKAVQSLDG